MKLRTQFLPRELETHTSSNFSCDAAACASPLLPAMQADASTWRRIETIPCVPYDLQRGLPNKPPSQLMGSVMDLNAKIGGPVTDEDVLGMWASHSGVEVLEYKTVSDERGRHLEYSVLFCSNEEDSVDHSKQARLVQRRFSEFDQLRRTLAPFARRAHITLPPLPSKFTFGFALAAKLGARRQVLLQKWLSEIVLCPSLWCEPLRCFLGMSPSPETLADRDDGVNIRRAAVVAVKEVSVIDSADSADFAKQMAAADRRFNV